MIIGLLAGAAAAIAAALLSLPLRSPDDAFFNTATVVIGALVAGLLAGTLRSVLGQRNFLIAWGVAFVAVLAGLVAGESLFERMVSFGVPLAAVVFLVTGAAVVLLQDATVPRMPLLAGAAAVVAIALGLGLAGQGDAESGTLALPAAPAAPTAAMGSTGGSSAPATSTAATTTPATTATGATAASSAAVTRADVQNATFVVGKGSQATFTVNEKLAQLELPNDAVMRTTALAGDMRVDGRASKVTLDLKQLTSDQSRRDNFVRNMFRAQPTAVVTIPTLTGLPERYELGQVVKQQVNGTIAINGVEKPITLEVEARMDGAVLNVLGRTSFVWADFNITPPNTPSVKVQDRVAVEVLLVGQKQAG